MAYALKTKRAMLSFPENLLFDILGDIPELQSTFKISIEKEKLYRDYMCRYRAQKCAAASRNIGFRLTFDQWCKIWQDSGHLDERGRTVGLYVMARKKDKGAYAMGNVIIQLCSDNISSGWKFRGGKTLPK